MIQRAIIWAAALGAVATTASIGVIGAAVAIFALTKPALGEAGAAAIVALICALIILIVGLAASRRPLSGSRFVAPPPASLTEQLMEMARAKPVTAAGVAVAAAALAALNPSMIGAVTRAFFEGLNRPKPPRR